MSIRSPIRRRSSEASDMPFRLGAILVQCAYPRHGLNKRRNDQLWPWRGRLREKVKYLWLWRNFPASIFSYMYLDCAGKVPKWDKCHFFWYMYHFWWRSAPILSTLRNPSVPGKYVEHWWLRTIIIMLFVRFKTQEVSSIAVCAQGQAAAQRAVWAVASYARSSTGAASREQGITYSQSLASWHDRGSSEVRTFMLSQQNVII